MFDFLLIACLRRLAVLLSALACAAVLPAPAFATASASGPVPGRIGDRPTAHRECFRPLLDRVVPRMDDVGTSEGRFLIARDQQLASDSCRDRTRPEVG